MLRMEQQDDFVMPSIPVNNGMVRLRDLRDLVEATSGLDDDAIGHVFVDEIRVQVTT